jgi:pilus assembly protein CpaE
MEPLTLGLVIEDKDLRLDVQTSIHEMPVRVLMDQPEISDWVAFLEKLGRVRPDVLLVELTRLNLTLDEAVRSLKANVAAPMVVVLHKSADPELILAALRAGANEYLYAPFGEKLKKSLERLALERLKQRGGRAQGGKAIAFLSVKGGCGSTTIACHVAAEIARQSRQQVLLADFDLDAGLVSFLMKSRSKYSLIDAIKNINRLDLSFWKALVSNGLPGLEVIAAPSAMTPKEHLNPEQVRHVLRFVRSCYQWTIVDLGRSLSLLSMHALGEIDELYLVSTMELLSLHQTRQIAEALVHSGYRRDRMHLILNRTPKRPPLTWEEIEKLLGLSLYAVLPDESTELHSCYTEGKLLSATSQLGKHLGRLAAKLAGTETENKRKFLIFG